MVSRPEAGPQDENCGVRGCGDAETVRGRDRCACKLSSLSPTSNVKATGWGTCHPRVESFRQFAVLISEKGAAGAQGTDQDSDELKSAATGEPRSNKLAKTDDDQHQRLYPFEDVTPVLLVDTASAKPRILPHDTHDPIPSLRMIPTGVRTWTGTSCR